MDPRHLKLKRNIIAHIAKGWLGLYSQGSYATKQMTLLMKTQAVTKASAHRGCISDSGACNGIYTMNSAWSDLYGVLSSPMLPCLARLNSGVRLSESKDYRTHMSNNIGIRTGLDTKHLGSTQVLTIMCTSSVSKAGTQAM